MHQNVSLQVNKLFCNLTKNRNFKLFEKINNATKKTQGFQEPKFHTQ